MLMFNVSFDKLLVLLLIICLASCKSQPVYNIEEAKIDSQYAKSVNYVKQAILRGSQRAGWSARVIAPGKIMASYSYKRNKFTAVVIIEYDRDSYSITHENSSNLSYKIRASGDSTFLDYMQDSNPFANDTGNSNQDPDAPKTTIHKIYNLWVKKLEQKINEELKAPTKAAAITNTTTTTRAPDKNPCGHHKPEKLVSASAGITVSKANIRSGAGTSCPIIGSLTQSDTFNLLGKKGNWYYIALADGGNAWIYASLVAKTGTANTQVATINKSGRNASRKRVPPPSAALPKKKISIAVIKFKTLNTQAQEISLGELVSEIFTSALVNSRSFKIIEREQLDKVIHEMEMTQTGFIDTSDAVKIGKMLHADAIITGSVALLGKQIQLNARIIDIESAFVISAESSTGQYTLKNISGMANSMVIGFSQKLNNASN